MACMKIAIIFSQHSKGKGKKKNILQEILAKLYQKNFTIF